MAGLYIHIPFCSQKCIYCDFYSVPGREKIDGYLNSLLTEFNLRINELEGEKINTLYIGGGTPSLLSLNQIERLVNGIGKICNIGNVAEFTMEVNPDDITTGYAKGLHGIGINRISMGIQSFNDEELKIIKRRHNSAQAANAIDNLISAGFSNVSIDLIYCLPGQTAESWNDTVNKAVSSGVPHISAYGLTYEEGTAIYKMRERGEVGEAPENTYVEFYNILVEKLLKAGFEHYEISNFAIDGRYSRHNCSYWNDTAYLGLGSSAHSYSGKTRRFNPNGVREYIRAINNGEIFYRIEKETLYEKYNDFVMTRLRTMWGIDMTELKEKFGEELASYFKKNSMKYILSGDILTEDNMIKISPRGIMLSDSIFRDLFYV